MGLMVYILRSPFHPAKVVSKLGEFLVAALSNIQSDAKLLQSEKNYLCYSSE